MNRNRLAGLTVDPDQIIMGGIGLLFFLAGIGLLLIFGTKVTLDCDRNLPPAGKCILQKTGILTSRHHDFALPDLQRAVVDVSQGDTDSDDTYRVVLVTDGGAVALTSYYSSGASAKQKAADQINAFLKYDGQQSVSVSLDDRIFMSIFSGIFSGAGVLMLGFAVLKTIRLIREQGNESE